MLIKLSTWSCLKIRMQDKVTISRLITLVNTQNVSLTKIVDSPSIQLAETKYGLRIQFLTLAFMIHEVWLNA